MIYTITFNPSLDYIIEVKNLALGVTNRTSYEYLLPGGKGLNVSFVLKNLGIESTALGFVAGFVGEEIEKRVKQAGIEADFIHLPEGCSRINVKVRNVDGTEINGQGPELNEKRVEELVQKLEQSLSPGDILVLAGSIPTSVDNSIYRNLAARFAERGVAIAVDATGELLSRVLPYRPFLIKPNHHELGELFGVRLTERKEAIPYAKKLQEQGARNVLVSLGGAGAVLVDETGGVHESVAPEGKVVNSVGAGDSMVAGFLAGWLDRKDYGHAFRMGLAAGSASAFSENLASKEEIEGLLHKIG